MTMSYDEAYDKAYEDMENEAEEVLSDATDYEVECYNPDITLDITIEGVTVSVTINIQDWWGSLEYFVDDGLGGIDTILGIDEFREDYISAYAEENVEAAMDNYDWSDEVSENRKPKAKVKKVVVKKTASKTKAKSKPKKPVKKTAKPKAKPKAKRGCRR